MILKLSQDTDYINKGKSLIYYETKPRLVFCYHFDSKTWSTGCSSKDEGAHQRIEFLKKLISSRVPDFHIKGISTLGIDRFTGGNMCHVLFDHFEREYRASEKNLTYDNFLLCDTSWDWIKKTSENIIKPIHRVFYLKPYALYLTDDLIVYNEDLRPKHPANNCSQDYLTYLRNRFHEYACKISSSETLAANHKPETKRYANKKIFVSRKNKVRGATNLKEVETVFSDHGFKTLYFEDLSFEDQILASFYATHFAGFHGAGLTNIIACQGNAVIYEVFTSKGSRAYVRIAKALGNRYLAYDERNSEQPLEVNCSKLEEALKTLPEN